ncbi:MAG: DUF1648 domain-containing protein [Clostridia bacterium]|nr:DUF1648 domain-containing protein [Clostridia bacterium]
MKFMKWKILCITCLVCLLPIVPGLFLWESLPDSIAIHFDIHNNPDNYASKGFVVFGLPCLMLLLQVFCCFVNDINAAKHGDRVKFERITKWIIPIMSIVLQGMTFAVALGQNVDVRKVAVLIVGIILLVIGNYLPKFDYIKNYDIDTQKARKINRFIGFETVIMGVLFLASLFLPPVASLICIFLLIPYAIISILYGIKVGRK